MSFILDALKKSEAERNRQSGPTLYEMRTAPRRAPLPTWVVVIGGVLALNLAGLAYLLLRRPAAPLPAAPVVAPAPATPTAAQPVTGAAPPLEPLSIRPEPVAAEPSPSATPVPVPGPAHSSPRPVEGPVASLADMAASGANLPALRLSLHAYDADGARRFILLNGLRLREGEATPEGLQVERIVEDGAVLSWHGRRFMLPRGE